jgi:multidrug efflux pump subunit AcrB
MQAPAAAYRAHVLSYGMVGALIMLWVMGQPFEFMAFLGIVSLVGVI